MSIPNSRELVATTHFSVPDFNAASISARSSLETDPWWARAITAGTPVTVVDCAISCAGSRLVGAANDSGSCSSAHNSFSAPVSRSAARREFTNTNVDRLSITWS